MAKKNEDFSKTDLLRLLHQPQTQALLAYLQQMDASVLQEAAQKAAQGDTAGAQQLLSPLLEDEQVRRLTDEMRQDHGGI